jgi:hypothetical protein
MLEFYAVSVDFDADSRARMDAATMIAAPLRARTITLAVASAMLVAACATAPIGPAPSAPAQAAPLPRNAEPPPPPVNLSGFPLPYRQGYADGCASAKGAERKDADRFGADPDYRLGWMDGISLCRKK